jgi:hypothetical protein
MAQVINNCLGGGDSGIYQVKYKVSFCDSSNIWYDNKDSGLQTVEHGADFSDKEVKLAGSFRTSKQLTGMVETITLNFKYTGDQPHFLSQLRSRYAKYAQGNANDYQAFLNGGLNLTIEYTFTNGSSETYIFNNLTIAPDNLLGIGEDNEHEFSIEATVPMTGFTVNSIGVPTKLPDAFIEAYDFKLTGAPTLSAGKLDLSKVIFTQKTINGKTLFEKYSVIKWDSNGNMSYVAQFVDSMSAQTAVQYATGDTIAIAGHLEPGVTSFTDVQLLIYKGV